MYIIVGQGPEKIEHGPSKTEHGTQGGYTGLNSTEAEGENYSTLRVHLGNKDKTEKLGSTNVPAGEMNYSWCA